LKRNEARGEAAEVKQLPFERERFKFQRRRSFLNGERGRQAVVYMEGVLIVGLVSFHLFPMYT